MRLRAVFSILALFAILFAEDSGAQTGARPAQPTPEQLARMPLQTLLVADFKLLTAKTGWVSTGDQLLMTTDDGAQWKDISPPNPDGDKYASVFFHDVDNGWILFAHQIQEGENPTPDSVENGELLYLLATADGGEKWTKENLPVWEGQHGLTGQGIIAFADKLHGWMSLTEARNTLFSSSAELSTSDGGRTWNWAKSGIDGIVEGILAVTDKDIWMVGRSGEDGPQMGVSHDGGKSFQAVVLPAPKEIAPFDSPEYDLPIFTSNMNGYVAVSFSDGESDRSDSAKVLFATQDGGRTWKLDRILSNVYQHEVLHYAIADGTWIVSFAPKSSKSALVKVYSGGRTSVDKHPLGEITTCELSFHTKSEGWKSCSEGLFSTIDGGSIWTTITPRVSNGVLTTSTYSSQN